MANTKKTTKKSKATDTSKPLYIAVDKPSPSSIVSVDDYLMACIMDGEYYTDNDLEELRDTVESDGVEEDHVVYKVTFTKVGTLQRAKVNFVKEG